MSLRTRWRNAMQLPMPSGNLYKRQEITAQLFWYAHAHTVKFALQGNTFISSDCRRWRCNLTCPVPFILQQSEMANCLYPNFAVLSGCTKVDNKAQLQQTGRTSQLGMSSCPGIGVSAKAQHFPEVRWKLLQGIREAVSLERSTQASELTSA